MTCQHEFSLNGLQLDNDLSTSPEGYQIRVMADDFKPGSHEAVLSVVAALGADGSSVRDERADNAETSFLVEVSGPDHQALAAGEAALRRAFPASGDQVALVHRPCDGTSPASVRDVLHGALEYRFDDLDESQRRTRIYEVTLTHVPFVRSEFPSVTPALTVGAVAETVVVDTCDSASGWSSDNGPVTASGGALYAVRTWSGSVVAPYPYTLTMTRAGAVPVSSTPYLMVEAQAGTLQPPAPATVSLVTDDGTILPPMRSRLLASGYIQHTYDTTGHTLSAVRVQAASTRASYTDSLFLRITHVSRTNNPNGTPRQSMRTIQVGGTERSPGTIHVARTSGSGPLGTTIIHTSPHVPGGYDPDLMRWVVPERSSPAVADPTSPSGKTHELGPGGLDVVTYSPSSTYAEGTFAIGGYVHSTVDQSVEFVTTVAGAIPGGTDFREIRREFTLVKLKANKWTYVTLSLETLPAMRGPAGSTWVTVTAPAAAPTLRIAGLWAFSAREDCSLSVVEGEQPHLWVDSPTVGSAADVWVSETADRSLGYYPSQGVTDAGLPLLSAGAVDAYVVTAGADNPAVDYSHHRRWTYHAADDGRG